MLIQERGEEMQLAQRKIKILKAVVESYIKSGDPVGSKALCSVLDFPVSSATVRNDMAELAELGLLMQPHTSAGRIPSQQGYRLYVSELMEKKKLPEHIKALITASLEGAADDPERILRKASEVVSQITHTTVITTTPSSETSRIRRLKFVQTGRQTCMVVLIASSGLVKNRLFKCDYVITPEIIRIYDVSLNKKLSGLPISGFTPAFVQTLAVEFGDMAMLIPNVLAAIMDACAEVQNVSIAVAGKASLFFNGAGDLNTARGLIRFLNSDEEMESFVMGIDPDKRVLIGSEIGNDILEDYCVLNSTYNIEASSGGRISVIAPMRIDYAYVFAVLDYTAECVSRLIRELLMLDGY